MASIKSLGAAGLLLIAMGGVTLGAERLDLSVGEGDWAFVGGAWSQVEGAGAVITAPGVQNVEAVAIRRDLAYSDFEARFEFQLREKFASTGFVFRAADAGHYYLVHFPMIGQQQRAKHFWAAVSKVNGSAWVEVLHMQLVPGVPSEAPSNAWHTARVVAKGPDIRVWVNGRPLAAVHDESYATGAVGLEGWTNSSPSRFRNVRITGPALKHSTWTQNKEPARTWFQPYPGGSGAWQHALMCMTRAPNNDLLMLFADGDVPGISRSTDDGRTWGELEVLDKQRGDSVIHTTNDGRLIMQHAADAKFYQSESKDNGRTWSDFVQTPTGPWPTDRYNLKVWSPSPLVELDDGTLLRFVLGGEVNRPQLSVYDWGSFHAVAFSLRSTDGGATWSAPVSLDGPPGSGINFDLTEPVAAQLPNGQVVCFVRPIYSPFSWETRSTDRAESWSPTARAAFPSYACSLICTRSGVLVYTGRFPGQGLHISRDGAMTWKSYRIDQTIWANGTLYEVKPDVVLYVHMTKGKLRGQFIRITDDGAEPAMDMLP